MFKEKNFKMIVFISILSILMLFVTNVNAKGEVGDILTHGDFIDGKVGYGNGTGLTFYDNESHVIASIVTTYGGITIGELPNNLFSVSVEEYPNNPDYCINCVPNANASKFFEYIEDYSTYWRIISFLSNTYAGGRHYALSPVTYEKPSFEIECDPSVISYGEKSICTLSVSHNLKIDSISFQLNHDKFNISDLLLGEDFEDLEEHDGVYSLNSKNIDKENDSRIKTTILTFSIEPQNEDEVIDIENNINASDILYEDAVANDREDIVSTKVETVITGTEENIENPYTSTPIYSLLLLMGLVLVGSLVIKKNKNTNNN